MSLKSLTIQRINTLTYLHQSISEILCVCNFAKVSQLIAVFDLFTLQKYKINTHHIVRNNNKFVHSQSKLHFNQTNVYMYSVYLWYEREKIVN